MSCPFTHSTKRDGVWTRGTAEESVEVVTYANGIIAVKLRCNHCGELGGALPKTVIWEWLPPFGQVVQRGHLGAPCSVTSCDSRETEYHHFAPRNTFGWDAEEWPVLPLCRTHHTEWHRRMDGYRWHQAAS